LSAKRWRLIDTGLGEAFFNMALDESIARLAIERKAPPALRVYGWSRPSVTLGRFQRAADVDSELCAARGIPVVRRPTGGRAILHGDELTYSFSSPANMGHMTEGLFRSYATLSRAFLLAFLSLGIEVKASGRKRGVRTDRSPLCFSSTSFGEITLEGRKIIGSAQRRWPGGMLQQGSIPLEPPRHDTAAVFFRTREHDANEAGSLMGLHEVDTSITYESLRQALSKGFQQSLGISLVETPPSAEEIETAAMLEETKYSQEEWNFIR